MVIDYVIFFLFLFRLTISLGESIIRKIKNQTVEREQVTQQKSLCREPRPVETRQGRRRQWTREGGPERRVLRDGPVWSDVFRVKE